MRFNPAVQGNFTVPPFYVGNHPLEDVSSFPYLGSIHTPDNDMAEEFNMRIGRARGVFFKLKVMESVWYPEGYQHQTLQCCGVIHLTVWWTMSE